MTLLRLFFILVILSASSHASAAVLWSVTSCGNQSSGFIYTSYSQALDHAKDYCNINGNWGFSVGTPAPDSSGYHASYRRYWVPNNSTDSTGTVSATLSCTSPNVKVAGTPPSCSCPSGNTYVSDGVCVPTCTDTASTTTIKSFSGSAPGGVAPSLGDANAEFCASNSCKYKFHSSFASADATATHGANMYNAYGYPLGTSCFAPSGSPTAGASAPPANFQQTPKFTAQYESGQKCGTVNGVATCLGGIPNGSCVTTAGGFSVCATPQGVPPVSPPAPDTGTPGVAVAPGLSVTSSAAPGTTTSFYSSSNTSGSTVQPPAGTTTGSASSGTGSTDSDCHAQGNCTPEEGTFSAPSPSYDFGDFNAEVSDAKQRYTDAIAAIRSDATSELHQLSAGAGTLPSMPIDVEIPDFFDWHFDFDLNVYADKLAWVGLALLLVAAFAAAMIILS